MARYDHLPIFRAAYDLTVHIEKIVRNFGRYHKYTLGTDLRNKSRGILEKIITANNARDDRATRLLELRQEIESFKVLARLCQDSGAFASTRSYLHVAERITNIARQNEGWIKKTRGKGRRRQAPPASPPQWGGLRGGNKLNWGFRGGEVWPELEGCEHPFIPSGRARFIIVRPSRLPFGEGMVIQAVVPSWWGIGRRWFW